MSTNQPVWEFVCNLGDVNVADHGGFIVYRDTTGVYSPEVEMYQANDDETGGMMYRFILEPFSPDEWFMDKLAEVASYVDRPTADLLADLQSADIRRVASAYQSIVSYFGPFEFDQYPVQLSEDAAQERYAKVAR